MKELYSFDVKREIIKEVPYIKKTKNGPVESTKKQKKTVQTRMAIIKPTISDMEDAEFYFGQKYNSFINAGFLTKAMLAKKMGDLGGMTSKRTDDAISEMVLENLEASRVIEFFEGAKDLDEEQKEKLKEAKLTFASTQKSIHQYESSLRDQFSQTADAKAEQKLVEWFVVNFSYYEDEVKDDKDGKKELFPLFEGESFKERREFLVDLQDLEEEETKDPHLLRLKTLYNSSFETLIRVITIWYNKLATDQKSIDKTLKDLFSEDEGEKEEEV